MRNLQDYFYLEEFLNLEKTSIDHDTKIHFNLLPIVYFEEFYLYNSFQLWLAYKMMGGY